MYRFFVPQSISFQSVSFMSRQTNMQGSMKVCSFCNFYHRKIPKSIIYHQIRESVSMRNQLGVQSNVKKKKQKTKNYAELLEVTDKITSNRKAIIKKLNAHNLYMLMGEPYDTVDKLHEFSDPCVNASVHLGNSTSQDNEILQNINADMLSDMTEAEYCGNIDQENENLANTVKTLDDDVADLDKSELLSADVGEIEIQNESKMSTQKNKKKEKPISLMPMRSTKKNTDQYVEDLLIHLKIYIECGMADKAYKTLLTYRNLVTKKFKLSQTCVKLYNVLLGHYSSREEIRNLMNVYDMMKHDDILPNPQTFAAVISAFKNVGNRKGLQGLLEKIKADMFKNNISFNDVFRKSLFLSDQRETLLKAVRILEPDFQPTYDKPNVEPNCKLMEKFPRINNYRSQVEGVFTKEELQDLLKQQFQNECQTELEIKSIERFDGDKEFILKCREDVAKLEKEWKTIISAAFSKNLHYLEKKENMSVRSLIHLHPFLKILDLEEYINTVLNEIRKISDGSQNYATSISFLHYQLGFAIFKKYENKVLKNSGLLETTHDIFTKYLDWYLHPENKKKSGPLNSRSVWQLIEYERQNHGPSSHVTCPEWPREVCVNIGRFLYKILLNDVVLTPSTANITQSIPAIYILYTNTNGHMVEQVKPHPFVAKLYRDSKPETLKFEPTDVPTCCPPRPWISGLVGGYTILKTSFIRAIKRNELNVIQNTSINQLYPVLDSLNELGNVPWSINTFILDIVTKIFQDGGSTKYHVPESVTKLPLPPVLPPDATKEQKIEVMREIIRYKRRKNEMYGLWCEALYKLSLANHFRDKVFWLPHSTDFRGRVYPIPPHLNHLSSDLGRAILCFGKGKPLGPRGLDWLKIHLINLTGIKKGSPVHECLKYANENLDKILDSAANPLTGEQWWLKSDEPWQTLAACNEVANALKSPNVEEYVSYYPIHQDGSCNGLQHYAALGRDEIGAKSVNLTPSERPQDVYASVVALIESIRESDAAKNVLIAKQLDGYVKRKVIKQTVMTTVYGVTRYGAKAQIMKQLKDIEDFPVSSTWPATMYLTEKTFFSIRQMFKSARLIQDWFTQCAKVISGECDENVEWVTPLGFPVIQPYRKLDKPDTLKQRNAFPPNFIHSLDSTHMMLTSLYSADAGITFVSVHDCFWTHPCTVDIMNRICREQFVALHSEPILEDLSEFLIKRYVTMKGGKPHGDKDAKIYKLFKSIPKKGKFDINNVLKSTYFFS